MKDGRQYVRRRTSEYLLVTDRDSGKMLGRITNVSPKGIMVMSAGALVVGQTYQLDINLPAGIFDGVDIGLSAECRWNREEKRSELWENGLEIREISTESRKILQQVVVRLMTHNGECHETSGAESGQNEKLEYVRMKRYR